MRSIFKKINISFHNFSEMKKHGVCWTPREYLRHVICEAVLSAQH